MLKFLKPRRQSRKKVNEESDDEFYPARILTQAESVNDDDSDEEIDSDEHEIEIKSVDNNESKWLIENIFLFPFNFLKIIVVVFFNCY